jgi:hypothetical protein
MSDENSGSEPKKNEVGEGDLDSVTGGTFIIEEPLPQPTCGNDGTKPWPWPTPLPFPRPLPYPVNPPGVIDPEFI